MISLSVDVIEGSKIEEFEFVYEIKPPVVSVISCDIETL